VTDAQKAKGGERGEPKVETENSEWRKSIQNGGKNAGMRKECRNGGKNRGMEERMEEWKKEWRNGGYSG
jgi:hypothetical protein